MFSVERRRLGYVKVAAVLGGVGGIVEPESDMKCIGRIQGNIRIEAEDLVEQNSFDGCLEMTETVRL